MKPGDVAPSSGAARRDGARDVWLVVASLAMVAAYAALPFLRLSGEGWGRGWNLVAYWFYSTPIVLLTGIVMAWRMLRAEAAARRAAWLLPMAALLYPLVAYLVIRSTNTGG